MQTYIHISVYVYIIVYLKMSSITRENVQRFCRTCLRNLTTENDHTVIKEGKPLCYHIDRTPNLNKWMEIFKPLENMTHLANGVLQEHCPQYVCHLCYENFKHANEFKEMVLHSYNVLAVLFASKEIEQVNHQENISLNELFVKSEPIGNDEYEEDDWNRTEQSSVQIENAFFVDEDRNENYGELIPSVDMPDADNSTSIREQIKLEGTEIIEAPFLNEASSPQLFNDEEGQPKATKSFKCMQCNISYIHKYTYVAHIRQMHLGIERAFECELCHKKYTKFCNLYRHMRQEHNESLRQFKCEYSNCNRSFRQLTTRRKHYEKFHNHTPLSNQEEKISHKKENKNFNYFCDDPLASVTSITKTERNVTHSKRLFICPICASIFDTSYDLKVHMNKIHMDAMKFACHICGIQKISQMKLDEHIATVHNIPKAICDICQKALKSKSHLRQHILSVHSGVKPYACEYCPSTFAAKNTLRVHTRIHTGEKPFKCPVCHRRFTQLSPMKKHLERHEKGRFNAITESDFN